VAVKQGMTVCKDSAGLTQKLIAGSSEHDNATSGPIKCREILG
jgi:hypothetical protein